ncbi:MAG: hypothetical protein K2X52_14975 [Mycobacteriaceae bacterium]|jgi:hypothetical protein|nr:hypothetical protein [Mycobacteriaceae bacterium]
MNQWSGHILTAPIEVRAWRIQSLEEGPVLEIDYRAMDAILCDSLDNLLRKVQSVFARGGR